MGCEEVRERSGHALGAVRKVEIESRSSLDMAEVPEVGGRGPGPNLGAGRFDRGSRRVFRCLELLMKFDENRKFPGIPDYTHENR